MRIPALAFAILSIPIPCVAQAIGTQGGVSLPRWEPGVGPDREMLERFITVEGRAELRVVPDRLRVVFAVTSEGPTPEVCRTDSGKQLAELTAALGAVGVGADGVTVDFIAMLPTYGWQVEEQSGRQVAVEKLTGHRLQENVHVSVPDEAAARQVIGTAFAVGVSNVIAVDHWSSVLDGARQVAMEKALAAAQRKAVVLLAVFDTKPKAVNVSESTEVVRPDGMYVSFENAYAGAMSQPYSRDALPSVAAFRPKNTFLRGFVGDVDVQSGAVPMEPYIAVVSTVRIHYRTPDALPLPPALPPERR